MRKYALLLGLMFVSTVQAAVIDFEGMTTNSGGGIVNNNYAEDGFFVLGNTDLFGFADGWQNYRGASNGTTVAGLVGSLSGGQFTLSRVDAGDFSLQSIDLAEVFESSDSAYEFNATQVIVTGQTTGNTTVQRTLSLDMLRDGQGGVDDFQTFSFDGSWGSLTSVQFATLEPNAYLSFDNIVTGAAVVPVPAAVWLFGSALAGLGWMRRRS